MRSTLKEAFGLLCVIALAIGMAAAVVGWHAFAFWAFSVTIACGIATLRIKPRPNAVLSELRGDL